MKNLLHTYRHEISYTHIRHLNKSCANDVTIYVNQILPSTLSFGKSINAAINNSDGKQQTMTGSKTTYYTNGVAFQLHTTNPTVTILTQNIAKSECGVFSKGLREMLRSFCPNSEPNFIEATAVTI